jgi:hypothetical protein
MSFETIRTAIIEYLQPLSPDTIAYARQVVDASDLARPPKPTESYLLENGEDDEVVDALCITGGDVRGDEPLTTIRFAGASPREESGLFIREYMFSVWLFKDARVFTRDDIILQLEVYINALLEEQTLGGVALVRSQQPSVESVPLGTEEYGDYEYYYGVLTVAYQDLWAVEER